jgi:hypothetical protein
MAVRPDSTIESAAPRHDVSDTELEQYGVWVKAEPHDIVEESGAKGAEPLDISEFDLPSDAPALPEESFLTEDEEKLIGSFDEIDSSGGTEEASLPLDTELEAEAPKTEAFPDIEDLPPLEDFEIGGAEEVKFRPDADINVEEIEGLGDFAGGAPAESTEPSPVEPLEGLEPLAGEMEDVSAEFLDVIEEEGSAAPKDVTADFLESSAEEKPEDAKPAAPAESFEPLDIDLSFDDSIASPPKGGDGFEEVSDFDDFLKETEAPKEAAEKSAAPVDFDDVAALEAELSVSEAQSEPESRKAEPQAGLSNELLLKIADELSSIRGELVNLKGQLGALQKEGEPAKEPPAASPGADQKSAEQRGGFFDEEEDETIALTGDELDNILNTADFTEESAPDSAQEGAEKEEEALDLGAESLLPESGDYAAEAEEPAIEEIRLEPETEEIPPVEAPEENELADLSVEPMTSAPEDTSYLEEPLAGEEPLDLGETPLHEEPLVEPDLSSFKIEEEAEPEAEVAEELPVIEEPSESEASPEALADITLGLEAASDYMAGDKGSETNAEAFTIEPIPEIETSSFEEIELPGETDLEDVEELYSDEESPAAAKEENLDEEILERTVKPSEPVSLNPDEIPMSLDDSFFVESPEEKASEPASEPLMAEPLAEEAEAEPLEAEPLEAEPLVEEPLAAEPVVEEAEPLASVPAAAEEVPEVKAAPAAAKRDEGGNERLKGEIRGVLSYLDKLLESLPEDKIEEFARSEYFDTYKKLFEELGLV